MATLLSLSAIQRTAAQQDVWTTHGPEGGWITNLAIDPQNSSIVYAGTFSAGVFKSADGGTNWAHINEGLTDPLILALAIDPASPATVYVGTNSGIFKTVDGGERWRSVNTGLPEPSRSVSAIGISRSSPTVLYVRLVSNDDVFKSTDGGETWNATGAAVANANVGDLLIDPEFPSTLYIGGLGHGVVKSEDGGTSWHDANIGLTTTAVEALLFDPRTATTLYAATRGGGVFKSTDGADSWNPINTGLSDLSVRALTMDSASMTLYAGAGSQVFRSTDAAGNWTTSATGLPGSAVTALASAAWSGIYTGTDSHGVFKSRDGGEAWSAANAGLIATAIQAVTVDPHSTNVVYGGVFKSVDGGETWINNEAGLPGRSIRRLAIDPRTAGTMYARTPLGVFKTTDAGSTWTVVNNGITAPGFIISLVIDPQTPATVYAASGSLPPDIFKTVNGGQNWFRIARPSSTENATLVIDPVTPTTLYAGTFSGLYKTTNGGASWEPTGLTGGRVRAVALAPQNPDVVFAYESCCKGPRVMRSLDGGAHWISVNNGLPAVDVITDLAVDSQTPTTVYASARRFSTDVRGGVFRSRDSGGSWNDASDGLTNPTVSGLAIDPNNPNRIYAGTNGGVFTLTASPIPRFPLTVSKSGPGSGAATSEPGGIDCGADCSEDFSEGTTVTLTATPEIGSIFTSWDGCDAVSGDRCTVVMSGAKAVTATFVGVPLPVRF